MSGCADVCLSCNYDYDSNDFYAESEHRAAKAHECCECRQPIPSGERYQKAVGKMRRGDFFTERTCLACVDVRRAFCCEGWSFGDLWGQIREELFPVWREAGPWDCLAKLTRDDAIALCNAEYAEWCADHDDENNTAAPGETGAEG